MVRRAGRRVTAGGERDEERAAGGRKGEKLSNRREGGDGAWLTMRGLSFGLGADPMAFSLLRSANDSMMTTRKMLC